MKPAKRAISPVLPRRSSEALSTEDLLRKGIIALRQTEHMRESNEFVVNAIGDFVRQHAELDPPSGLS